MENKGAKLSPEVGFQNGTFAHSKENLREESDSAKEQTFKEALVEFTQNTTIHGVREITEDQPFKIRRVLWMLLVLCGLGAFCYQLVTSILMFLSRPTTVNIKINYNHTINFPAFTVCNHNSFRMTKVAEMNDYDLISTIYGAEHVEMDWSQEPHAKMSMKDLYHKTAHDLDDLIVDCLWDERPCSADDFQILPTDYGLCYSFNKVSQEKVKEVDETGVEGGLRLLLNIEQYEYMPGPNSGAGLKISLHDPNESPSVRDHGFALPPGSHTLVAAKITETENLESPYGKCDESRKLTHFDHYSIQNCRDDCVIEQQLQKCGCRSISMPEKLQDKYNICTLQDDHECVKGQEAKEERCPYCSVPCNMLTYDSTISYSSLSNFDLDELLHDDFVDKLERKFLGARETSERVNESKVRTNERLITNLKSTYDYLTSTFVKIRYELDNALDMLHTDLTSVLLQHIKFHHDQGLDRVSFVLKYNFARGYEIRKERYFDFVCADFYSISKRSQFLFQSFMDSTDDSVVQSAWMSYKSFLATRKWLATKSKEELRAVNTSYYTGEQMLNFDASLDERYDTYWISLSLLRKNIETQQFMYMEELEVNLDILSDSIFKLLQIGEMVVANKTFAVDDFTNATSKLEGACRKVNYRLFMMVDYVVYSPHKGAEKIQEQFEEANETLIRHLHELKRTKNEIIELIDGIENGCWPKVRTIIDNSMNYLNNKTHFKTTLARYIISEEVGMITKSLETIFDGIQSRSRELIDKWENLNRSVVDVWERMLTEETTKKIYEKIYDDFQEYISVPELETNYIRIFADLLGTSESEMEKTYPNWDLEAKLNANFHVMNLSKKIEEIHANMTNFINKTNVLDYLNEKDTLFLTEFEEYRQEMASFLAGNEINTKFFTDNFVRLDVFMQELSYEEIIQQPSYEIMNVVGDIGGAMGLFMGGSLLTIIAVFDFFVHFWLKTAAK